MELYHNSRKNTTIFPEKEKWKKCKIPLYKQANTCYNSLVVRYAPVAQWIEHRIPVPRVGGSSPFRRTKKTDTHLSICLFVYPRDGRTRTIECGCPVDTRQPQLDGGSSLAYRVPSGVPKKQIVPAFLFILERKGPEPTDAGVRWTPACRSSMAAALPIKICVF